jgi:YggT family protein
VLLATLVAVVNAVVILYILLLVMRSVLSWFSGTWLGRPWDLLRRVTDPYLGLFYRARFLRRGAADFTPMAAVLVLVVLLTFVNELFGGGHVVGRILAAVLLAVWAGVEVMLLLFLVVGVLRAMPVVFRTMPNAALWRDLDRLVAPVVAAVSRFFRLERRATYTQRLLLTLGLLLVAGLLGRWAVRGFSPIEIRGLAGLLQRRLPF